MPILYCVCRTCSPLVTVRAEPSGSISADWLWSSRTVWAIRYAAAHEGAAGPAHGGISFTFPGTFHREARWQMALPAAVAKRKNDCSSRSPYRSSLEGHNPMADRSSRTRAQARNAPSAAGRQQSSDYGFLRDAGNRPANSVADFSERPMVESRNSAPRSFATV